MREPAEKRGGLSDKSIKECGFPCRLLTMIPTISSREMAPAKSLSHAE